MGSVHGYVERPHIGKNVWPYLSVEEMDVLKINGDDEDDELWWDWTVVRLNFCGLQPVMLDQSFVDMLCCGIELVWVHPAIVGSKFCGNHLWWDQGFVELKYRGLELLWVRTAVGS